MQTLEIKTQGAPKIAPIFLTNRISATLIIPIDLARRHQLNEPSHVILEERDEGILIKKIRSLEVGDKNDK